MASSHSAKEEHSLSDVFAGVAPEGGCPGCGPETCCACNGTDMEPDGEISERPELGMHYACKSCYLYAVEA